MALSEAGGGRFVLPISMSGGRKLTVAPVRSVRAPKGGKRNFYVAPKGKGRRR